jgi:hypothetical protein
MPNNQYTVLQVTRHSSTLDIRKNYKKLSKLYHPDKNPDKGNEFNNIKIAYDVRDDDSNLLFLDDSNVLLSMVLNCSSEYYLWYVSKYASNDSIIY